ncbi:DUF596 domain-containing protein [Pseudomonas sichuanensis]|uniref:DUF596 domain-containing protein n=1 Tax=Pseudomonas sichuanensis TaxID=2213015 RepID=UPI002ACB0CBC|nr:DUF596 domain-containing protein [Pseudomonas sichuanensis]
MIEVLYKSVLRSAFGLSMGVIWQHMSVELFGSTVDCARRVSLFFSLMERLMLEGNIRLAHDGLFLVGTMQDQLDVLKEAWPEDPGEDELDGFGLWFITEAPAGLVWIDSDGKEFWT